MPLHICLMYILRNCFQTGFNATKEPQYHRYNAPPALSRSNNNLYNIGPPTQPVQQHQQHHRHATYNIPNQNLYANQPQQQQKHIPLQHSYTNPAPPQQQQIVYNYPSGTQTLSPRQLPPNYNIQYNKPTLGAQIRAHHSPNQNEMDSDEGTESASDSQSSTATDFIDSQSDSNSESDSMSSESDTNTISKERIITNPTRQISAQTHTSSSHKVSSVWSRTPLDSRLSQSESDQRRESKKQCQFQYPKALGSSTKTLSETQESFYNITPDHTPRTSMLFDGKFPDAYVPNMNVIYDDAISMTHSKSLEISKSKSKLTTYSRKSTEKFWIYILSF